MEVEHSRSGHMIVDLVFEQGAGHHDALDLVGAFVNLGDFSRSPHRPRD